MHNLALLDAIIASLKILGAAPVGSALTLSHHEALHDTYRRACALSTRLQAVHGVLPVPGSDRAVSPMPLPMRALSQADVQTLLVVKEPSVCTGCQWSVYRPAGVGTTMHVFLAAVARGSPADSVGLARYIGWRVLRINAKIVPHDVLPDYAESLSRIVFVLTNHDGAIAEQCGSDPVQT
eukprot:TRINITY_DN61527_c0_g1_i1.p1 TRINITY_DN61527_c0_g1~~TRINITY_DN61527_c0_g1_i1.p1  ORF type:complete len:196 (+),score=22.57 TRINITY_DN61527_c0_g1_i1:51-590(+)